MNKNIEDIFLNNTKDSFEENSEFNYPEKDINSTFYEEESNISNEDNDDKLCNEKLESMLDSNFKHCFGDYFCDDELDFKCSLDEELEYIKSAKLGDIFAINYIFKKYKPIIFRSVGLYFMKGYELDDIIQEGYIGLFHAIKKFDENKGKEFGSFAKVCIKGHILDAVRYSTRKKHSPLNNSISINKSDDENSDRISFVIEYNNMSNNDNPENIVLSMESVEQITDLISKELTPLEENVLNLHLKGDSYDEISKKLGKNYKSIDNAVQRARKKLEKVL